MNEPAEPTEEQLREAMKKLRVEDILLQTIVTLVNLAGRRLTVPDEKDAEQAKLAIEAVRALLPLAPGEEMKPVRDALAQLQMVYVKETQQPEAPEQEEQRDDEVERAKARSKIWTPPGT